MGKRHKHLIGQIATTENLYAAYQKAARGKRDSLGHLVFREHLAANLGVLRDALATGEYRPGVPREFMVHEPKPRLITAMPFVDRVAQHALCNVIEPIFDKVFLPQSYACRRDKGTHACAIDVQAALRRAPDSWVLKTDFSKYFASIRRDVLHTEYRRKISCQRTLALIESIIPATGTGIPIGNLTSQLSANLIGHVLDRWLVHQVGHFRFFRYMDDVVVLGHSKEALQLLRMAMGWFADARLGLTFSHWSVAPAAHGINFVGYRIWPTHKLLRRRSVLAAKRKLARLTGEPRRLFIASWLGHAAWANSHNLLNRMEVLQ